MHVAYPIICSFAHLHKYEHTHLLIVTGVTEGHDQKPITDDKPTTRSNKQKPTTHKIQPQLQKREKQTTKGSQAGSVANHRIATNNRSKPTPQEPTSKFFGPSPRKQRLAVYRRQVCVCGRCPRATCVFNVNVSVRSPCPSKALEIFTISCIVQKGVAIY